MICGYLMVLALLLMAGCVPHALQAPPGYANRRSVPVRVLHVSQEEAARRCPVHPSSAGRIACAYYYLRPCLIILGPDPLPGTLEHERAHCEGWQHG